MRNPKECHEKWIEGPTEMMERRRTNDSTATLLRENKIPQFPTTDLNGAAIQARLEKCDLSEQYERDVAMWYGYCKDGSKGAQLALRIFGMMKTFGVLYKHSEGWKCTSHLNIPIASLLSHGGRVLVLLPMSNSARKIIFSKLGALVKGVTVDPVVALGNRGTYHTMRSASTLAAVTGHSLFRVTGLSSLMAILSTGHKVCDAGDDRFWSWFSGGDVHDRGLATHSTVAQDWGNAPRLGFQRALWFTEEKAGMGSNVRDGLMGRHHYKNLALGGIGQRNPFSGVKIEKDGSHGHLYINYRPPGYKSFGCLLLGVEGSAPGKNNQYGKVHDAEGTKGKWSATGGKKWDEILPVAKSDDKQDVTTWVCDLSDFHTSKAYGAVVGAKFTIDNLSDTPLPVKEADWAEVFKRI
ncbi:MAG: hypothetical protein JWR40_3579 [Massilia sp.]|jgi:hypothetical protein|nr:hypothetical protein [Massilia sp.]